MNFSGFALALCVCCVLITSRHTLHAQEIPVETWRTHTSFNRVQIITTQSTANSQQVFAAAPYGILALTISGGATTTRTFTRLNALNSTTITALDYDAARNQLLVGYEDGNLDIITNQQVVQFTQLRNPSGITGSTRINHICVRQNLAYLTTEYGVVVFDLVQLLVRETWRDLGVNGSSLPIRQSTFRDDSVFLATGNGVLAGSLNTNLLNFANWKRFNLGVFNATVPVITTFNNKIYTGINGAGLFAYDQGQWTLQHLSGESFNALAASVNLWIATTGKVWQVSANNVLSELTNSKITVPLAVNESGPGMVWIGDARNGLFTGNGETYVPNGPTFSETFRLSRDGFNQVYAMSGGYTATFTPAGKNELINSFTGGVWRTENNLLSQDVTDVAFEGVTTYVATFGNGLQVIENNQAVTYTTGNSPLLSNRITTLAASTDGLWVTAYGNSPSLYLLKPDKTWEPITLPYSGAQFPLQMITDQLGQVWVALNPQLGGGLVVYSHKDNRSVLLTEANGAGALPSRQVYALSADRNGQVWVGTAAGVAYFPNPAQVFSGTVNAVRPIINGRFLLRDETVTAIAVDGGNRKWLGTQRGAWLVNPFGEEEIYRFNTANSPLPEDRIADIEVHPVSGEVFFATSKGIVSFRSTATQGEATFSEIRIFPNPVTADFTGLVSITGLTTDAHVKITDISGKLIWQTRASGGSATWNVRDYNGRRAATGIYLVIAVAEDGSHSIIGKVAVVN